MILVVSPGDAFIINEITKKLKNNIADFFFMDFKHKGFFEQI
jgi:hypothetical protein